MSDISHNAYMVQQIVAEAAGQLTRPFIMLKPAIYPDGSQWCALYGENLQEGVAGFGDTPEAASRAFDKEWYGRKLAGAQS
jgi:hypothetical protein